MYMYIILHIYIYIDLISATENRPETPATQTRLRIANHKSYKQT